MEENMRDVRNRDPLGSGVGVSLLIERRKVFPAANEYDLAGNISACRGLWHVRRFAGMVARHHGKVRRL